MGLRKKLYRLMEASNRERGISTINLLIVILVLASFVTFSLETEASLPPDFRMALGQISVAIVLIFAVEYLVRVWIAGENPEFRGVSGRLKYITSPYPLADLFAFLPELIVLVAMRDVDGDAIAALKALRLLRLLKLARFVPAFSMLSGALARCASQLAVALGLALALIYVSAIALYFIEGDIQPEKFGSIPRATWWAVATLTTVGYGDAYPVTPFGKCVAALIALAGIGVVALPAGIFASAVSDEMKDREVHKDEDS